MSDDERREGVLQQREHGVVDRNPRLPALDDARRAEEPHELDQPQRPQHAQRLELANVAATVGRGAVGDGNVAKGAHQDTHQVDAEPAAQVSDGDLVRIDEGFVV